MRHDLRAGLWGAAVAAVVTTALSGLAQPPLTVIEELALDTALAPEYGGVPTGAVIFTVADACPSGWTGYAAGEGRYLVGLVAGGTAAGTAGTALSDQENRSVGRHNHSFSGSSHNHTFSGSSHTHGYASSGSHAHTITVGGHTHTYTAIGAITYQSFRSAGGVPNLTAVRTAPKVAATTGSTTPTASAASATVSLSGTTAATTGSGSVSSTTVGGSVGTTGATTGTNAPYVQLRLCQRD